MGLGSSLAFILFLTCLKGFVLQKKELLAPVVPRLAAFFSKISTFPALRRIQSGANPICRQMTRAGEGQRSRHNRGEQIHRKDHQMHYALQHRGSSRAQRQRGNQQRQDQQHGRFRVNAQGQSPAGGERDNCHCWAVQRASCRSRAEVTLVGCWYGYEYCYLFHSLLRTIYLGWRLFDLIRYLPQTRYPPSPRSRIGANLIASEVSPLARWRERVRVRVGETGINL